MQVSSARTSKDLFFCRVKLCCLSTIWLTKMLAKKPKCWQTNQNACKQTKMLTSQPKFWQTNLNSSKETKFVCQDFGLFKFKFNEIPISHLEAETPFGLVFWLVDVLFWLKSSLWLLIRRWEEASSFGRLWKFLEVFIMWAFMWTFLEHLYNGTLRKSKSIAAFAIFLDHAFFGL